ncbi:hypothetical protein G3I60_04725 [Streptomyces sp. SID13666]|uniref:hypothetical protein n=1 Tax=unclassified Streptomyces TaxID=2593676 RepID=UPI0013C0261D|nr:MULTISPECIES: hypothetical protein [unclassified Streptomyces]NEA53478.1 hypothetical protein [Streptomyces sp. SID13666]NEA69198.1 hypothetical protein [Streptomyces sp. SID13588]
MRHDPSPPIPHTDICDVFARRLTDGCRLAVVRDSSAVHARDPARDGLRLIATCSPEHLTTLQDEYHQRPFIPEELWAGKILRALAQQPDGITGEALSAATGLDDLQIQRAGAWQQHHARRMQRSEHPPRSSEG